MLGDAVLAVAEQAVTAVDVALGQDDAVQGIDRYRPVALRPVDPDCRRQVDPAAATGWERHEGEWYFCSTDCLRTFLVDPEPCLLTFDVVPGA